MFIFPERMREGRGQQFSSVFPSDAVMFCFYKKKLFIAVEVVVVSEPPFPDAHTFVAKVLQC